MSEKLWHLRRCDLFELLEPEQLARLERRSRMRTFPRRSLLYAPADPADGVLLLASGRAKISTLTDEGKEAILTFVEPGELFGEMAVFEPERREEYAQACERSTVILIPADEMHRLMQEQPEVSIRVTRWMGLKRRRIERRLKYLMFRPNRERLLHALSELAEQYGYLSDGGVHLRIRLSHQELANLIGSTRESVTLLLKELQAEGILSVGRRKIVLTDPEKLARSLNVPPPHAGGSGRRRTLWGVTSASTATSGFIRHWVTALRRNSISRGRKGGLPTRATRRKINGKSRATKRKPNPY